MATALNSPPAAPRVRREPRHSEPGASPARRLTPAQVAQVLDAIERGLAELEVGPYDTGSASVAVAWRRGDELSVGRPAITIALRDGR
jgi:hypothetical protein